MIFVDRDTILLFGARPSRHKPSAHALPNCGDCTSGAALVSINPLRERGLERLTGPQSLGRNADNVRDEDLLGVRKGPSIWRRLRADQGVAKRVLELGDEALTNGTARVLDTASL